MSFNGKRSVEFDTYLNRTGENGFPGIMLKRSPAVTCSTSFAAPDLKNIYANVDSEQV